MDVRINVVGQKLVVSSNYIKLIGGSNKFIRFVFALDSSWADLMPYAQFTQNNTSYNVYLDSNNAVFLPPEITDGTCTLTLGGSGNGVVATTDYVKFNITGSILSEGQESTDITESMYEQLVDRVVSVRDGQSDLRSLITTESETRAQADTEIRQLITSESNQRESDISSLTLSVEAANNYGTTLNQRITSEASTRATADASMQTQIDNYTASTNNTINNFKSETNSSISDIRSSISNIRASIGNDISDVRDEIDDAVAVLNSRMDLALQQLNKHEIQTILFDDDQDSLAYIGDNVTLLDDPTTFDYIDFYYKTHVNSSGQGNWDKVFRFEPNSNQPTIVSVQPSDSSATNKTLYVHEISFSLVGTEITVVRSRRWYWNGNANAAASLQQSDENSGTAPDNMYGGRVYKIVGVNISDIDELTDLRIGTDGTVYQSAGTAIRTQLSGIQNKSASDVSYSVANSGLNANNVQGAIDEIVETSNEINERLTELEGGSTGGADIPTEVRQAIYNLFNDSAYKSSTGHTADISVLQSWATEVTDITISQSTISISGAATSQLTATTSPAGGLVTWASSDASVATVSGSGLVTGVGNGTAKITASCGGKKAVCAVTVSGFASLTGITATYTQSGNVYAGDDLNTLKSDLVVVGTYSDSTTKTLTGYTLSGTLAVGTSTITAHYGGYTATFSVTVSPAPPRYTLKQGSTAMSSGNSLTLSDGTHCTVVTNTNSRNAYYSLTKSGQMAITDATMFTLSAGDTWEFKVKNIVFTYNKVAENYFYVRLYNGETATPVTTGQITYTQTTAGTREDVTATGTVEESVDATCVRFLFYRASEFEFDFEFYVNGVRYL